MSDVIVAGGGIGGLALAAGLRRAGVDVTVIESRPAEHGAGAGISLWANALAALDSIGLGDDVRSIGASAEFADIRRADGRVLSRVPATLVADVLGEPPVCVHRADLLDVLAAAAGDCVRRGVSVTGYELGGDRVAVRLSSGETLDAGVLIGADGVTSAVAAGLQPGLTPHYAGWTAWRAVADLPADVVLDAAFESWGRGERFGVVPLPGRRAYWFATANRPEGERGDAGEWVEVAERFGTWHDPISQVVKATDPDTVLRHDIYDRPALRRWVSGRVAVLGDAAHPMQPNLGQGGCQALDDAALLARLLGDGPVDVAAALESYEATRRPVAERVVRRSQRLGVVAQLSGAVGCRLRDTVLRATPARVTVRSLRSFAAGR